jgi:hypothetical protein
MDTEMSDLDTAWEQVVAARACDDASAEARTLTLLARALHQAGRSAEACAVGEEVIDRARHCLDEREILMQLHGISMQCVAWQEEAAQSSDWYGSTDGGDPDLLRSAHAAYRQALPALDALADAPEPLKEEARARATAVYRSPPRPPDGYGPGGLEVAEVVIAGFLAVKVLGPFLEAWATKLGELAGESTARVLGRVHIKKITHSYSGWGAGELPEDRTELVAPFPNTFPIILVLPRHLSDAAKLALIDLNPADRAVGGETLYWCADAGAWLSEQKRAARGCPTCQHPDNGATCSPAPRRRGRHTGARGQRPSSWP